MSTGQVIVIVFGFLFVIVTPAMFKAWLSSREKKMEIESRVQLSHQETERMKVLAGMMQPHPISPKTQL